MDSMTKQPEDLLAKNREWSAAMREEKPDFFLQLAHQQNPDYLWIGCSDSRVPANRITGTDPGEIFVHRNIANQVISTDLSCLSVLQFAIDCLKVKHVIVTGHYGCGGIEAAINNSKLGVADNWLGQIQNIQRKHRSLLEGLSQQEVNNRMCELNVAEQVANVCQTTIVQNAWLHGQSVTVHGWIYDLKDGLLQDLGLRVASGEQLEQQYQSVVDQIRAGEQHKGG